MQTESDEIRALVREELIGIIEDAQTQLGTVKDPTGMGRKVLDGMISLIRKRGVDPSESPAGENQV
jgi:hypothetical protein